MTENRQRCGVLRPGRLDFFVAWLPVRPDVPDVVERPGDRDAWQTVLADLGVQVAPLVGGAQPAEPGHQVGLAIAQVAELLADQAALRLLARAVIGVDGQFAVVLLNLSGSLSRAARRACSSDTT